MIERILLSLVLLLVIGPAWAMPEARLLNQSTSGETALFNLGSQDGIREGDFAVIVKEIRDLSFRDLRIVPVAKAKNIKMNTQNSVWVLYKIYDAELLVKGDPFLLLSESEMLSGRRDPKLGRISVVTEQDKASLRARQALGDDKDRIAKLKNQYPEITPYHQRDMRSDSDATLVDIDAWKKHKSTQHSTALYKSPSQDDFRRELRLNTFEKLVTAYVQKVNEPGFSYDAFYDEQMKTQYSNEFRERSNFSTEYEAFVSTEAQKAKSNAKVYRSALEKGESWSEDFSDEELKGVLKEVSVLQEKDRRHNVMVNPNRYSVYISYGMGLNDEQTDADSYRRGNSYAVELAFEGTPFIKHEILERFTLDVSARSNKTAFAADTVNASLDETSFSGGVNWYPVYAPYALEAPCLFLGTYFRSGWGQAHSPTAGETANYTILTFPGVRAGMKYNFKNNVGIRITATLETMSLDSYEQSKIDSVLPDDTSLSEGKINFALAYSF